VHLVKCSGIYTHCQDRDTDAFSLLTLLFTISVSAIEKFNQKKSEFKTIFEKLARKFFETY
jgi:hypothetical protein